MRRAAARGGGLVSANSVVCCSHRTKTKNSFRRRGKVSAAAAGDQRALTVVNISFGGRVLTTRAYDSGFRDQIAGHGRFVIVDPDIDGRKRAAEMRRDCIVGGNVDDRGKNAAMCIAADGTNDPVHAPFRPAMARAGADLTARGAESPAGCRSRDQVWGALARVYGQVQTR